VIFWQKNAPRELIQLMPKRDVVSLNILSEESYFGPVRTMTHYDIEEFKVPIKIVSATQAKFKLRLTNSTWRNEATNFGFFSKGNSYSEEATYEGEITGEWIFIPVKANNFMRISIPSD
jgi:hypothetical protein